MSAVKHHIFLLEQNNNSTQRVRMKRLGFIVSFSVPAQI